jgi:riboflavin synthase
MFSGIIEDVALVREIVRVGGNIHFVISTSFVEEIDIDQSIAHNGVCLTVSGRTVNCYVVTAIEETLERTNLRLLKVGDCVNVERSMKINGRLDGHIVQGHVDRTAVCTGVREADGSRYFSFEYDFDRAMAQLGYLTVEKGSVCVNGVSLTVCNSRDGGFETAIIPYTFENTNFCHIETGTVVNLEFDIIGKYISKLVDLRQ